MGNLSIVFSSFKGNKGETAIPNRLWQFKN